MIWQMESIRKREPSRKIGGMTAFRGKHELDFSISSTRYTGRETPGIFESLGVRASDDQGGVEVGGFECTKFLDVFLQRFGEAV